MIFQMLDNERLMSCELVSAAAISGEITMPSRFDAAARRHGPRDIPVRDRSERDGRLHRRRQRAEEQNADPQRRRQPVLEQRGHHEPEDRKEDERGAQDREVQPPVPQRRHDVLARQARAMKEEEESDSGGADDTERGSDGSLGWQKRGDRDGDQQGDDKGIGTHSARMLRFVVLAGAMVSNEYRPSRNLSRASVIQVAGMLRVTVASFEDAEACPLRNVLDRLGDKWSLLILTVLEDGPQRFNEIKRLLGDISQRVLAQKLRHLERDGYVSRKGTRRPLAQGRLCTHRDGSVVAHADHAADAVGDRHASAGSPRAHPLRQLEEHGDLNSQSRDERDASHNLPHRAHARRASRTPDCCLSRRPRHIYQ